MTVATFPAYEYKYKKRLSDMIRRILHIQPGQQLYSLDDDIKFIQPRSLGGVPIWWTNNGAIPAPIAAYRAVNTPASIWGAGPTSLAESYVNLVNPGTNDAAPGVAPTWDATGWTNDGTKHLTTGIIEFPTNRTWSMICRISDLSAGATAQIAMGYYRTSGGDATFLVQANNSGGSHSYYHGTTGNVTVVAGAVTAGTLGIAGTNIYYNGSDEGNISTTGTPGAAIEIYLMGFNVNGSAGQRIVGKMQAVWIANYDASAYMATLHTILGQL